MLASREVWLSESFLTDSEGDAPNVRISEDEGRERRLCFHSRFLRAMVEAARKRSVRGSCFEGGASWAPASVWS